jgi:hypothetical protein
VGQEIYFGKKLSLGLGATCQARGHHATESSQCDAMWGTKRENFLKVYLTDEILKQDFFSKNTSRVAEN